MGTKKTISEPHIATDAGMADTDSTNAFQPHAASIFAHDEPPDRGSIPASAVKRADIAMLSLDYRDDLPVLTVGPGTIIPESLTVVDADGATVAIYTAAKRSGPQPRTSAGLVIRTEPSPPRFPRRPAQD